MKLHYTRLNHLLKMLYPRELKSFLEAKDIAWEGLFMSLQL
ncbi:hypothetical protein BT93_H3531 [Corymbia citriodora subsp. variegata]|nr:hypothetical protein BT93_H3531 [Corymbia citriodora subsp. variegata]